MIFLGLWVGDLLLLRVLSVCLFDFFFLLPSFPFLSFWLEGRRAGVKLLMIILLNIGNY